MSVTGISRMVDSCSDMVHKKAIKTYQHIAPENKRWIDLEDVIQEGLIKAWETEQSYTQHWAESDAPTHFKSKFSTYLFRGLDMLFSGRYSIPLSARKRVTKLVELDAPIGGEDGASHIDIPSHNVSPERMFQAISGVVQVCYAIPPAALSFLLGVIVSDAGRIRRRTANDIACIPDACSRFGVTRYDLELIMGDLESKSRVLESVMAADAKLGEDDVKVLECVTCRGMFSLGDVRTGNYSVTSLTCHACLKKLYEESDSSSCFGRMKVVYNNKTATEGYSEADTECRLHCRDRAACRKFIKEGRTNMTPEKVANMEFDLEDVDLSNIEAAEPVATTTKPAKSSSKKAAAKAPAKTVTKAVKKAEPVKAAKKAEAPKADKTAVKAPAKVATKKAAKPEGEKHVRTAKSTAKIDPKVAKAQGLIKLDDQGRDLPFKQGSTMRYCLEQALAPGGVKEKDLERELTKLGYSYPLQRFVLMSGKSGDSSFRPYPSTHVWKAEVKGDRIIVSDVKRIAFYHKMARIQSAK
jgi:hypothetical protein